MKSKIVALLGLFFFLSIIALAPVSANPSKLDPNDIVRKADAIRVPGGSYLLDITITDFVGEKEKGKKGYKVYTKDLDHSLVEFRSPAKERGKSLLLLEDDVWIFLPKIRRPVRVPLQQRLLGQVAVGDMLRVNFAHDYNATLIGEEDFNGTLAFVLDLKAKTPKKTYQKIKYWVAKETYRPLFAEYFTVSGKAVKTLTFEEFRLVEGKKRPMLGIFRDTLNNDKITRLRFNKMTRKRLQDMMFTKTYMRTFE